MIVRPNFATDIAQDLRVATRRMRREPVLTAAIVLTLGLGLGAASVIFLAADAALVEPVPFAEPDRLVHLWELREGTDERSPTSYPTLLDWRARARGFEAIEGYDPANFTVGVGGEARMTRGAGVTPGFFRLLGVRMSVGRDFLQEGDAVVEPAVAVITDRFARAAAVTPASGGTITINGTPHTIIGVLPPSFHFALLQDADVFVSVDVAALRRAERFDRSLHVVGRLRRGVPLATAAAEVEAVMAELARTDADAMAGRTISARSLRDALLGTMKPIVNSALIAAALLLVIMGANLALLMLARYVERAPELTMRAALGATRGRVLRQLLVENLAPALSGAVLAVAIAHEATPAVLAAVPEAVLIGMPYLAHARLDAGMIAGIIAIATGLSVVFGLGPAVLVTRTRTRAGDARTTLSRGDRRLRRGLVAAQLAIAVVLLVASGLLVLSFRNLVQRDLGFGDPERLVTLRAPLSGPRYDEPSAQQQFYEALLEHASSLPGVSAVGLIDEVPGGGGGMTTFEPTDRPLARATQPRVALRTVGGAYFSTMGIRLEAGRTFTPRDDGNAPHVAVVSASLARRLAADGPVLGRRLRLAATGGTEWEVVGVAGDVQIAALDADSPPVVYLSHLQAPENRMMLVLRSDLDAVSVAGDVRRIVQTLDRGVPVYAVTTLRRQLAQSRAVFSRRFPMILCGVFGVAALALTLVALYAVSTHDVATRRREFAIRIALGGTADSIRRLILGDAVPIGAVGIGAGLLAAAVVARSLDALLFGIAATDWRVYAAVGAGVLAFAFGATLRPALRAGSVDPAIVMRHE